MSAILGTSRLSKMVDEVTKKTLAAIPLLTTNSGPRDKENWVKRLKEEYAALIKVQPGHMIACAVVMAPLNFLVC